MQLKVKLFVWIVILFKIGFLLGCNLNAGNTKKIDFNLQQSPQSIIDCIECDSLLLTMDLLIDSFTLTSLTELSRANIDIFSTYFANQFDELYKDTITINYDNLDSNSVLLHDYKLTYVMKEEFIRSKTDAIVENRIRNIAYFIKNKIGENRNIDDLLKDSIFFKFYQSF